MPRAEHCPSLSTGTNRVHRHPLGTDNFLWPLIWKASLLQANPDFHPSIPLLPASAPRPALPWPLPDLSPSLNPGGLSSHPQSPSSPKAGSCLSKVRPTARQWEEETREEGVEAAGKIFSLLFGNRANPLMPYSNSTRVYGCNWDRTTCSIHSNFSASLL